MKTQVRSKIAAYYALTKPGVLYGNVLTVVAGFLFASNGKIDVIGLVCVTIGMTFVIAAACALNNYLDQDIDSRMTRTKKRPSVTGELSDTGMKVFAVVLGVLGLAVLYIGTNLLTTLISIIGFVVYVVFYGMLSKRMSMHGTLVGSVSGAIPILAGYVAVSNAVDIGAILVFAVLFFWQMPEFYSIAIYRRKEYKAAGVPVISVVKGVDATRKQIFAYTVAFVVSTLLLTVFGYSGVTYAVVMGLLGGYWLWLGIKGLQAKDADAWARQMFRFSLIILLAFSFIISVDAYLP